MVWPFTSTALLPAGLILRGGCISSPVLHVVLAVQQRPAATPSTAPPEGDTVSSRTEHVAVPLEPGGQIGEEEEFPHKVLEVDDEAASPSRNTITSWGAAEFSYFGGTADRYSESRNYELSNAQVYRRERSKKYSSLRLPALNRPADHSVRQERAHQGAGRTNGKQHHYRPRAAQEDVKMRPHRGSTRAATRPSTQHVRTARKREIGETRTAGAASSSADALLELNAGATGGFEIDEAALDHVDEQQMANDVEIILERELARTGPVPKPYSKRRLAAALVQKSMEEADARAWFATWHYTVKFDRPNVDHGGGVRHVAKLLRDAEFVRELNEFLQHGGTQLQKNTLQPTIIETEAIEKEERCEKDIKAEAAKAYDFAQLDPLPLGLQQAVIVMCGLTMLMVLFVLITSDLPPVAPVPPELERTFDAALAEQKAALVGEAKADAKVKAIAIKKGAMIDLTKVPKAKARAEGEAVAEAPVPRELADVGKRQQAQIGPGGSSMFGGVQSSAGASSAFGAGGSMASSSAMGSSAMAGSSALGGSAGFGAGSKSIRVHNFYPSSLRLAGTAKIQASESECRFCM
ncbi:unnamed protein product [Amoebophrya sp. A120]|nr:unnamed protein product [Amoebophrya sp. A120]|eukprot:GSA120T00012351001.1